MYTEKFENAWCDYLEAMQDYQSNRNTVERLDSEMLQLERYVEGMSSRFRLVVKSQRFKTHEEARNLAMDLERNDFMENINSVPPGNRRSEIEQLAESMNKLTSYIMKQEGVRKGNEKRVEQDGDKGVLGWFNCKGNGHLAAECTVPCKICRSSGHVYFKCVRYKPRERPSDTMLIIEEPSAGVLAIRRETKPDNLEPKPARFKAETGNENNKSAVEKLARTLNKDERIPLLGEKPN